MALTWNDEPKEKAFWSLPATAQGEVVVRNLTKNHVYRAKYGPESTFAVVIQADKGDEISVSIDPKVFNLSPQVRTFAAPYTGLGVSRGSTRAREFMMLLSWFLETADPVAYAPAWWLRPLEGVPAKNILMQLACDDPVVPIGSGISLARAAGLVSPGRMTELIAKGLPEGAVLAFDKEVPVESEQFRALRFHASGKHAYIIGGNNKDIEKSVQLGMAAQNQMAEFCRTAGALIITDPAFDFVLPDDNGQLLFDIPLPFGINPPP